MSNAHGRLPQLDGLRALAFTAVFLTHSLHVKMMWVGVDVFFVLSGFLITGILRRSRQEPDYFRSFYWRRFLRIFPAYYLFLISYFLFIDPANIDRAPVYGAFVSNFNESFHWFEPLSSLTVLWSLAIEEQFYLCWPLVVWSCSRGALVRVCLALMVAAPMARLGFTYSEAERLPAYFLTPCRVDLLAAGALLALLQESLSPEQFKRWSGRAPLLGVVCLATFLALAYLLEDFRTGANHPLYNTLAFSLIVGIALSVVAYLVPRGSGFAGRVLSSRPLVFLGSISYVCYLVHHLVLDRLELLGFPALKTAVMAYALTVLLATASWYLLERPMQRFRTAGFRGRHENAPQSLSNIGSLNPVDLASDSGQSGRALLQPKGAAER